MKLHTPPGYARVTVLALAVCSLTAISLIRPAPRLETAAKFTQTHARPGCSGLAKRSVAVGGQKQPGRRGLVKGLSVGLGLPTLATAIPSWDGKTLWGWQLAEAMTKLNTDEQSVVKMFDAATPSVVYITTFKSAQDSLTLGRGTYPTQAGSGFVWDKDGHIVTNLHVVDGADIVQVTFMGTVDIQAKVVGADPDTDLAVLKLMPASLGGSVKMPPATSASIRPTAISTQSTPSEGTTGRSSNSNPHEPGQFLKPVAFGDSNGLRVGQSVYAIGNPFGLDHTLTRGIISGLTRDMQSPGTGRFISDVIQTDAAINPGNSGGPLLDSEGKVIGVNTALLSPSGAFAGVGFALPIDLVRSVVKQLLDEGKVQRAVLGAVLAPDRTARMLGIDAGLLVLQVVPGSPAAEAGLRPTLRDEFGRPVLGDIILGANGSRVTQNSDFYRVVNKLGVGDNVNLEVLRKNTRESLSVTMASSRAIEKKIHDARVSLLQREQMEMEMEIPFDNQEE
mmetsp:Transcript_35005/g.68114  ORF Transcript_35005/g.68114 Transcript_35005/m.68114 type:complete len:506 (-) Transcript_35005:1358-2875(-)